MLWSWYFWDFSTGRTSSENVEEKRRSNLFSILKRNYFCETEFSICHITFTKKGSFLTFLNFLLPCPSRGLNTPFFRIYIHFCVQWYITCLYKLKIKVLQNFFTKKLVLSQKTTFVPWTLSYTKISFRRRRRLSWSPALQLVHFLRTYSA